MLFEKHYKIESLSKYPELGLYPVYPNEEEINIWNIYNRK